MLKKVIFLKKDNKKHEQNVVKSGLIIIPESRKEHAKSSLHSCKNVN